MKKNHTKKKLVLGKVNIAKLDHNTLAAVKGGTGIPDPDSKDSLCNTGDDRAGSGWPCIFTIGRNILLDNEQ
ncbi:class I lanthipeptide [Aquimarina sp. D1M17]|uniref:class I lanthipeptide n=1 Tax=Aquimarina acroporae TaxID=2937283 RepID=UPI0020C17D9A|nr:class I lanthipeptide [Aquimarina acroporae]MCK8520821.1 class I lanthipeptide [Aquimarina acroporae]